ncbi:hypothetical protein CF70_034240 [Cupriavidus sp. SK-3]|uniref:hypothetical protein n=1 Tax=Cupriavidus sp. SK-3 TaxID=1470558 RepID=UPI0004466BE5|nr:hypothetical protein [Cupriavidus sp. SK-3]KDP87775.1 hypothetical protein CF70_034240 [Cupriavidus sp. SK-3]
MQVTTNAASSERTQIANLKHYPRRVLLRRWGFSVDEAAGLLPDLPSLEGRLEWTLDDREKPRPDLVVHLVDATRLSGVCAGARWNAMGPVEAMRKARRRGTSEIAIVLGSVQHLPAERTGCWILAGERSLAAALTIVARTAIEPLFAAGAGRRSGFHELAAMNALCILATEQEQTSEALSKRLVSVLWTAVNRSYAVPARLMVAAQTHVMDHVDSFNPHLLQRIRAYRRNSGPVDLTADITIAYPWPVSAGPAL